MSKSKQCKHEHTAEKYGETTHDSDGFIVYEAQHLECLDCGAWLPLGPSADTPQTAIEIRAARIAAAFEADGGCEMSSLERHGFADEVLTLRGGCRIDLTGTQPAQWGYLARCIVDHDATHDADQAKAGE